MNWVATTFRLCTELDEHTSAQSDELEAACVEGDAGVALSLLNLITLEVAHRRLAQASFGVLSRVAGPAGQEIAEFLSPRVYEGSETDLVRRMLAQFAREGGLDTMVEGLD